MLAGGVGDTRAESARECTFCVGAAFTCVIACVNDGVQVDLMECFLAECLRLHVFLDISVQFRLLELSQR